MQEEKQFFSIFSDRNYSFLIIFFIFLVFHIGYSIFKRQKTLSFRTNAAAINVIVILKGYQDIYMRTIRAYPDSGVSGIPAFSTDR